MSGATTLVGARLGRRYQIESELGRGAMGVVYRAHDAELDREVAVKVLPGAAPDAASAARLMREARAAAALNHPNIVAVHDVGADDGSAFVVMELVEGPSLRAAGPLPLAEVLAIARQLCAALEHAHAHGIVHRDLKPENVLLAGTGSHRVAKLADLGVAQTGRTRLTAEGEIVGTAAYLAPEQALGRALDGRADLYALGVVLYELVTGRQPFLGDDALAVISQHLHAPVTPPRAFRADLPPELEGIILRLLAKDPAQRFASAREAGAALAEVTLEARAAEGVPQSGRVAILDQLVRGRMVGRTPELQQLRELWRLAQQGKRGVALISGEPGAGKTRLAHEAVVFARLNGAVILQGGCYEYEAAVPYLPIVEAVRRWAHEQPDEVLRAHAGPVASELAKLAPEIEARLGALPPSPPLGVNEERLRLFDHVARFLRSLAAERGLLLFVDDLHWADAGSLALLHYLMRNLEDARLLVLGTYREIELDRAHPLAGALVDWERERLVTRARLDRFRLEETAILLASLFGQETVSPEFAEAIHRETEGNPFFIEEVVKALIEQGQIYRSGDGWDRKEVREMTLPQSVKSAIGRRLDRLSEACAEALQTAAALGKQFEFGELAAVTSTGEEALLDALDEASGAQLVQSRGGEGFAFTHDKIREVLIEELNPIRRRRLHQRVGEGLEKLETARPGRRTEALAFHFTQSGDLERGYRYSLEAGRQAERLSALDHAVGLFERARECAEALERTDLLAAAEESLGRVYSSKGTAPESVAHFERALALQPDARRRAALRVSTGEILTRVGDPRGLDYLNQALTELDPATQSKELALATAGVGRYHHYWGRHHKAIEHLERARLLAEPSDDPRVLENVYSYLAGAYQHLARYAESDEWARTCIALGERHRQPYAIAVGHEFLAENAASRGLWREAVAHAEQDRAPATRIGSLDRVAWSWFCTASGLRIHGDLAGARDAQQKCVELCERLGEHRLEALISTWMVIPTLVDLGEEEEARRLASHWLETAERSGLLFLRLQARFGIAYLDFHRADWAGVLARVNEVEEILGDSESRVSRLVFTPYRCGALLGSGRTADALERSEGALAETREAGSQLVTAMLESVRGEIFEALGRYDEAAASHDRAVEQFIRLEARLELGRALERRARFRAARGEKKGAAADREAARARFEECGAKGDLARLAG